MGQLTAIILHELNTPVGVLKANADLARRCISRLRKSPDERRELALGILEKSSLSNVNASRPGEDTEIVIVLPTQQRNENLQRETVSA